MWHIGDKFILTNKDLKKYKIEIININEYRPPEQKYGVDIYDENNNYWGDVYFCDDKLLSLAEHIEE